MRRKKGSLMPIEIAILEVGLEMRRRGEHEFHGFAIAKEIRDREGARRLTAHGTLYKALGRLEQSGLLESRWEDPQVAAEEQRPRRRLYSVTGGAERAYAQVSMSTRREAAHIRPRLETT
jgi:PadR family transcriptional regulator PadR